MSSEYGPSNRNDDELNEADVLQIEIENEIFHSPNRSADKNQSPKKFNPRFKRGHRQTKKNSASIRRNKRKNRLLSHVVVTSRDPTHLITAQPRASSTDSIVQKHNFASEISITFDNKPSTSANKAIENSVCDIIDQPESIKTRIIKLNNKFVQKGVHLAIAVEKNTFLSKNALKKITRNLNQEFSESN